ncbi:WxL domain-containing protein [Latilactobacillus sp. 5-91]|uniref:WxL domain-containing protein n=1 Tax=Latilactobacillus sp. 5-91 TaxID=3410924 RepID=UPI003C765A15
MKKRIIYSLLIIFLLMTTVVQSLGAVLATSSTQDSDNSVKTSKIVDSSKAITQVSGSSQLRSSSQSVVQSSSEQQTSKKSESKKSSGKKASSKKQVKSVLIQPREVTDDTDYQYPDFSKTLSSQKGVITVNYDDTGNAHTSVADDSGTLVPDDSYNEIPYPNNAFPSFIPGVSTETLHGKLATAKNHQLSGEGLNGDEDYIYYTKVMTFRDENGKQHWIDVKQKFMGLEKHGWYNDWLQYKAKGYKSTSLDGLFVTNWGLGYGLGSNTNKSEQGLFGIGSTLKLDGFRAAKMTSPAGATLSNYAKADLKYRQAAKVKLEFYDNETGKPITISGFFTVADLDHRDFLQFSRDSNIQSVYVTNNTISNNILKGTFNPASDPSTVIVNSIGNNEYTDRNGNFANNYGEWGDENEVINPDNTDAWATITFNKTQSVEYAVSDWQRMDFLATALVPVAFSAPGKSGDGDEWNQDWDDNNINYNVVATLPYRGSKIKNPQHGNLESDTISTFHPTTKFELTDPINKNLKVDKVTIMQDGVTDVTANFDIDTTGNKVVAKAKADFLSKEDNYAKTYDMKVETSVAADADLGSLPTETATDDKGVKHTYAKIANTAHLDVVKVAGATAEGWDSNEAYGHVKIPDPVREVQDMKQEIKNEDTAGEDWQPIVDDTSTTAGHVGDKIGYRFSFKAKDSNTASITDASINAISVNTGMSAPTNAKVTVGSTTTDGTVVEGSKAGVYSIKIDTPIKKGEIVTVTFERTANKTGLLYLQTGFLKAASLTAAPDGHNLVPDGYLFNPAVITITAANNTADIQQFIKNRSVAAETWKGPGIGDDKAETSGVPGNIIDYKFVIKPGAKNGAALAATALKDITMKESGGMTLVNPEGSADDTKQVKITIDGSAPIYISGNPIGNGAELNDIVDPLEKGKGMTIEYSAKINDSAYTQNVTNDANFYASNLTGDMPATSTVADKAHKTAANQSILHIKNQREIEDMKQKIKNKTAGEDWQYDDTKDPKAETEGKIGDEIAYEFSFTAKSDNTADIEGQILNAIGIQKADQLTAPTNLKVTTGASDTPIAATLGGSGEDSYTVTLASGKGIKAGDVVKVYLERTVKDTAVAGDQYIQSGFTGDSLSADTNAPFNKAYLNIIAQHNTATVAQTVHNITRPAMDTIGDDTKASGVLGDLINYQFTIDVPKGNDEALLDAKLQDINNAINNEPFLLDLVPGTLKATINGQPIATAPSEAEFLNNKNGTVKLASTLINGIDQKIVISYQMKIGMEPIVDDSVDVQNDANFYASNLTGSGTFPGNQPADPSHLIPANATHLIIKKTQVQVSNLKQTISNTTKPANDQNDATTKEAIETSGKMGDTIRYTFKGETTTGNTEVLKQVAIKNIKLTEANAVDATDTMTFAEKSMNITVDDTVVMSNGNMTGNSVDVASTVKKSFKVTYLMKIKTNETKTIFNDGNLTATRLDNTTGNSEAFNQTKLNVVPQVNHATIQQFIRNPATALPGQAWFGPGFGDGKAETTGKPGDYVTYRFDITLPTDSTSGKYTNDAALTNAAIQDITMNVPDDLELVSLEGYPDKQIQISYGGTIVRSTVSGTLATLKDIALKSPLDADKKVMVQYRVQVKDNAKTQDVTNDANFYADNLTGDLTDKTVANYQYKTKANQSKLKIRNKKEVKLEQTLKNTTTEDTSASTDPKYPDKDGYRVETTAGKGDVIDYRYKVTAAADNTGNITNMKVNTITMKKSDKLSFSDPDTGKDYPLIVKISKADGTNETTDTGATFSSDHQTITLSQPLKPGYVATISYKMQVTASVDDNTLAADKVVTNDAKLTADELTETKTTSTGTENVLIAGNTMDFNQTILNLKKNIGEIIIRYVDLEDNDLSQPTYIATEVDEKGTSGVKLSTVNSARVAPKLIDGYTIHAVTEDADLTNANWSKAYKDDPVFTDKVRTITYGYYKRMLSVEAPSYWDFGTHNRTQTDSTYYLEDRKTPQAVKVTDHYGVDSWQLQVAQEKPFTDDRKQVLKDAELEFKNGTVIADAGNTTPNQAMSSIDSFNLKSGDTVKNLMTYTKSGIFQNADVDQDKSSETNRYSDDQGKGSWYYQFGNKQNADISIGLHVPDTTKRDDTTYTTTLDWTLTVAP